MPSAHKALFVLEDRPTPVPGAGQLLVKIYAAALNLVDTPIQQTGFVVHLYSFTAVPGSDGAGVVEAIDKDVEGWAKGDRVRAVMHGFWTADRGTLQQYAISDAIRTASRIPDDMSFEQASTIPLALGTASIGLYRARGIGLTPPWQGGTGKYTCQPILTLGGSSSVAIQLAKLFGFSPIITTASKSNEAYCRTAGATDVIDYHDVPCANLPAAVVKITSAPFKVIFAATAQEDCQRAGWSILAPGGDMVVTLPPLVGKSGKRSEADSRRRIVFMNGNINMPPTQDFGTAMYKALPKGAIKADIHLKKSLPNDIKICGYNLAGAFTGLESLAGGVSATKLVVLPHGT
ncbi:GroES-like protein [Vararia minispora EC-137]|uniref:GroES-like protein n=1 Tax=Vararia minispora EC-137 TaxID=1314806 RepID=A0ACB8QKM8_9AGAM|nr:GroES-like protein [Vararia minispora EC-137]